MRGFRAWDHLTGAFFLIWQGNPYTPILFVASIVSLAVAAYAIRQRGTPGAWAMAATMVAAGVWSAGYAMEIGAVEFQDKVFWAKMEYFGICVIPYCLFAFGVRYSGRHLKPAAWVALAVVPALTLILALTNGYHGLVWSSVGIEANGLFLVLGHGPAFWAYWVYSYLLIISGLLLILNVLFHSRRVYVKQGAIIILGLVTPWLGNSLYVLDAIPGIGSFDPTPVCFTFTGILIALGLFRYQLLDMVPVARHGVVEEMQDGVIVLDSRKRIVDVNAAASPLFELPISEIVGRKVDEVVIGWNSLDTDLYMQREVRIGRPERDYELTITPLTNSGKSPNRSARNGVIILFRDITERKRAERKLRESEDRYRRLVELSPDAIIVHSKGIIEYINQVGAKLLGASEPDELLGRALRDFVHPNYLDEAIARGKSNYAGEKTEPAELLFVRGNGEVIDVETSSMPITYQGRPAAQMVFREITERKNLEQQLSHQAFHDSLTSLPNRSLFMDELGRCLMPDPEVGERDARIVAILFLDLDGFKLVNDSLGHEYGDGLLVSVAKRIRASVRPNDLVARMGGDEFTVLLGGSSGVEEAETIASRISDSLSEPFHIREQEIFLTTSIGIVLGRPGEYSASEMLRDADAAMYEAKRELDTRYRLFEPRMGDLALHHLELKNDLRLALSHDEFVVHYQPKVSVKTGDVVGLEALVRWQHPRRGLLYPDQFLGVAESAGLMPEIGVQVFRKVLHQMVKWRATLSGSPVSVGINLSVRQLRHEEMADEILAYLRGSSISPTSIEFEITEDAFIEPDSPAIAVLRRLRGAGIRLSVDDFGTGYSSLSRLKLIPVDTIKIDKTLIGELDGEDATIVAGIIDLTHALGKTVVAEGVESVVQLAKLDELGCDFVQGNYFWPALMPEEVLAVLRERYTA